MCGALAARLTFHTFHFQVLVRAFLSWSQVMRSSSECDKADESLFKPSRPKLSSGLEIDGV